MKKFLFFLLLCTIIAIAYVDLQARIVLLSYQIKKLYEKKEELLSEKQYYLAKLLDITSPQDIKERLLARRIYLSYSTPRRVVCINARHKRERGIVGVLFGESQAVADVLE